MENGIKGTVLWLAIGTEGMALKFINIKKLSNDKMNRLSSRWCESVKKSFPKILCYVMNVMHETDIYSMDIRQWTGFSMAGLPSSFLLTVCNG